jgi:integrase
VQARNLLTVARRLFAWAIDQLTYGIKANPCDRLKPNKLIGDKPSRDVVLTEDELHALWRATRHGYPYQPLFRLLLLSGLGMNEVTRATWSEFDFKNGTWTVPASRMKGKTGKARAHVVPLTADIRAVLDALPRFKTGPFVFSNDFGRKPVWMTSLVKKKLDRQMLRTLRALARLRGEDTSKVTLAFRSHDIRRTLRTGLASLRIPRDTAEAVLGHVAGGVIGIYDRHDYADEKRHALETWAAKLRAIVEPPPYNVVRLAGKTR